MPEIPICQTDLPLDWYQAEFKPYAEEYLALPNRKAETVLPWLDQYAIPATKHFGDSLLLLAHFYMGGEIVKLVERYGGKVADSYQLALQAARHPEKKVIVESAVHFMAESIAILAAEDQTVWITNPKAGDEEMSEGGGLPRGKALERLAAMPSSPPEPGARRTRALHELDLVVGCASRAAVFFVPDRPGTRCRMDLARSIEGGASGKMRKTFPASPRSTAE